MLAGIHHVGLLCSHPVRPTTKGRPRLSALANVAFGGAL